MEREEYEKIIDERVGAIIARSLGVIKEWMEHQAGIIMELIATNKDSADRQFAEVRSDIARLQDDVTIIKINVASMDRRVEKLEKHHEHNYA